MINPSMDFEGDGNGTVGRSRIRASYRQAHMSTLNIEGLLIRGYQVPLVGVLVPVVRPVYSILMTRTPTPIATRKTARLGVYQDDLFLVMSSQY